jgi:hypothetical protein
MIAQIIALRRRMIDDMTRKGILRVSNPSSHRNAFDRTRSDTGLDRGARVPRKLNRKRERYAAGCGEQFHELCARSSANRSWEAD